MKFAADRPFANPEAATRKIVEIANTIELVQDARLHIENDVAALMGDGSGVLARAWHRHLLSENAARGTDLEFDNMPSRQLPLARWRTGAHTGNTAKSVSS